MFRNLVVQLSHLPQNPKVKSFITFLPELHEEAACVESCLVRHFYISDYQNTEM